MQEDMRSKPVVRSVWRFLKAGLIVVGIASVAAIGALYAFEFYVAKTDPAARDFWWQYPRQPLPTSWHPAATIANGMIASVYPNLDYNGTSPWETRGRVPESTVFHIRSNKFGFYTDHPIDNFPPKQNKEFRIILIGGSGAQGHGGSSNERMMYHLLEEKLALSLADTGFKIRVINLALAGHEARTNSGDLLAFGHAVDPDLILAYNGANDIAQLPKGYAGYCASYYEYFIRSTFIEPDWVRALGSQFPALSYRYGLATWIKRTFYASEYRRRANQECLRDLGVNTKRGPVMAALYRDAAAPMFVEHFKAIKRDFCGIPIMLAWQAVQDGERTAYDRWLTDFDPQTNPAAVLESLNAQEARIHFRNPERRTIHFTLTDHGEKKPTWDEVIRTSPSYDQASGIVSLNSDIFYRHAVTTSLRSATGFNINRAIPGHVQIYYVVLPAAPSSPPPTVDFVIDNGKSLTAGAVGYNFDPSTLKPGFEPTVYFVVKNKSMTSRVFKAREHNEVQAQHLPRVYYAIEAKSPEQTRIVYPAHTEQELYVFRRKRGVYQEFYRHNKAALAGYMNKYWYFLNVDRLANNVDPKTIPGMTPLSIAVHLDDVGQGVVANIIAEHLAPVVRDLIKSSDRPACPK